MGNVSLMLTECVATSILKLVKDTFMENGKTKIAGALMRKELSELKKEFDYEEYGGAPILGVEKPVLKIHGSSTGVAVTNAITKGLPYAEENVVEIIGQAILDLQETMEEEGE